MIKNEIVIPVLGESVSEATIAKWYKEVGNSVKVDELLLEIETEKVTLEINALSNGIIESISKKEGDTVNVGEVVGIINASSSLLQNSIEKTDSHTIPKKEINTKEETSITSLLVENKLADKLSTMPPSVKRMVAEHDLLANNIIGSGKDGRINKGDVINAIEERKSKKVYEEPVSVDINLDRPVKKVKLSRLRKTIAQRLKQSQNTAAILTTFNEIDMSYVIALRSKYREDFINKYNVKLGFMSFFVKAVVNALKEVPSVNAEISEEDIIYKYYYDIGIAVGTNQGLVVPVIRECNKLTFSDIEKELSRLAVKAREGKLSISDLSGGTFSITNGGIYGSLFSTPIINPPQTAIIGLHNNQQRPIAVDGRIEIRPMMYTALSYDHRIIDGKDAVTFLIKIKEAIENPERLLLDL